MMDEKSLREILQSVILQGVWDSEHWHPRAKMQGEMGDSAGKTA